MNYNELHDYVAKREPNICQIVAYKNGEKVYSDTWNGFKENDAYHVMSVTKSIVSLLVGIALDQGLIQSIDEPILDSFPEYQIKRGEKTIQQVTIRNLLTMTAPYKYRSEPWTKICTSENWTKTTLDFLGGKKGLIGEFRYSTLGIHILTGIIAKTSGLLTVEYANKYLFEPLGVTTHKNFSALNAAEHKEFTLSKKPREHIWFTDPEGIGTAGYGLCFSAEDMAKIGQMCLDRGKFADKQIVSESWIEESTRMHIEAMKEFQGFKYGYLWWVIDEKVGSYASIGNSGNVIYVNPKKEIVVAIAATFKPTVLDRIDFVLKVVEPFLS